MKIGCVGHDCDECRKLKEERDVLVKTLRDMRVAWSKAMSFLKMKAMFSRVDGILAVYPVNEEKKS